MSLYKYIIIYYIYISLLGIFCYTQIVALYEPISSSRDPQKTYPRCILIFTCDQERPQRIGTTTAYGYPSSTPRSTFDAWLKGNQFFPTKEKRRTTEELQRTLVESCRRYFINIDRCTYIYINSLYILYIRTLLYIHTCTSNVWSGSIVA